jgi:hypothetical protein
MKRPHGAHATGMEHRCGKRTTVDIDVRLIGALGAIGVGRMLDVSATGAFIYTLIEVPVLTPLDIEPIDPHRHLSEARAVAAFVVRRTTSGLGLEWSEFLPAIVNEWTSVEARRNNSFRSLRGPPEWSGTLVRGCYEDVALDRAQ